MADIPSIRVVLCTCPPDEADRLASNLVEDGLAACVNIVPAVQSVYRWKGAIERDEESLLVIKCGADAADRLTARLVEDHPYDVPEVIALPVIGGLPEYIRWVAEA